MARHRQDRAWSGQAGREEHPFARPRSVGPSLGSRQAAGFPLCQSLIAAGNCRASKCRAADLPPIAVPYSNGLHQHRPCLLPARRVLIKE